MIAQVMGISTDVLMEGATLERVRRREFLSLAALTAAHGGLASEMVASVAGKDPTGLTQIQTTHGADLVIASLVDRPGVVELRRWMRDGAEPVLRVNAAGILAKLPGQDSSREVATVLAADDETRMLYQTAVLSRVCVLDWDTAAAVAADLAATSPKRAQFLASRLAAETLNPRDAGARWCSAVLLRDLAPQLH